MRKKTKAESLNATEIAHKRGYRKVVGRIQELREQIIADVALRPDGITYQQIADRYQMDRATLHAFRRENYQEIEQVRKQLFDEAKAVVDKALIESCTGFIADTPKGPWQTPPNPKSLELFYRIRGEMVTDQDIDAFRQVDFYWPLPKQAEFIFSGDPFGRNFETHLITGIGYGKTRALWKKAVHIARRNRKRIGMLVSPTYKMLQHPLLEYALDELDKLGTKFIYRKNDGELVLWGDTVILLRSGDTPDNLRGPTLAWCGFDELRNMELDAYTIAAGRVRDPDARDRQLFSVSTPNGFNWMYEEIEGERGKAKIADGKMRVIYAQTDENPYLPADFVQMVRSTYDEQFALQELGGRFLNIGVGLIYHCFNRSVNVKEWEFNPSLPLWIGQDFNVSPMATVLMQPVRRGDGLTDVYVFDELTINNANIQDTIRELDARGYSPQKHRGEILVYPDATGFSNNAAATRAPIKQIEDAGYVVVSPRVNPLVRDRYAAVNGKLLNAFGVATLFISPKCVRLREDLEREVYKPGTSQRETVRDGAAKRGHHSDALGYPIHHEFRIESGFIPQRPS